MAFPFISRIKESINWLYENIHFRRKAGEVGTSFVNMYHSTIEQFRAVPEYSKTLIEQDKPRTIIKHTGRILVEDVLPIIVFNAANHQLQQMWRDGDNENNNAGLALSLGLYLADWLVWFFTKRKQAKVLTRTSVLLTQHSHAFDKATDKLREKVDDAVCKECTTLRFAKGRFTNLLVYYTQQIAIHFIGKTPLIGSPIAKFLTYLLDGQLFLGYRLDNDGLCDRHISVYFREYVELCLSLGFTFDTIVDLLTSAVESYTGLPKSYYHGAIKSLFSIYFVGLAHHLKLPKSQKSTNRLPDPLALVRGGVSWTVDVVTPGIKQKAESYFLDEAKPFPFRKWVNWTVNVYQDPTTQKILICFIPHMFLSAQDFVNDPVVSAYWPGVRDGALEHIDTVMSHRETLTHWTINWIPNAPKDFAVSYFADIPVSVAGGIVSLLQNAEFVDFLQNLRAGISNLKVGEERTAWEGTPEELTLALSDVSTKQDGFNASEYILKVKLGLGDYEEHVRKHSDSFLGPGPEGKKRLSFYQSLLGKYNEDPFASAVVCYAILTNGKSQQLRTRVQKRVNYKSSKSLDPLKMFIHSQFANQSLSEQDRARESLSAVISDINKEANGMPVYVTRVMNRIDALIQALRKPNRVEEVETPADEEHLTYMFT